MNKILRYSSQIKFLQKSIFFRESSIPQFSFSTKQNEKTLKKLEKEKVFEKVANLETIADQNDITKEKLKQLISERREEIHKVAEETEIPTNAIIAAALITAPVIIGGPLLNIFCIQNLFPSYLPSILSAYLKYNAVQLNFMVIKNN